MSFQRGVEVDDTPTKEQLAALVRTALENAAKPKA
jgi:hypothetical protein